VHAPAPSQAVWLAVASPEMSAAAQAASSVPALVAAQASATTAVLQFVIGAQVRSRVAL
jgi:hypothetical protein